MEAFNNGSQEGENEFASVSDHASRHSDGHAKCAELGSELKVPYKRFTDCKKYSTRKSQPGSWEYLNSRPRIQLKLLLVTSARQPRTNAPANGEGDS